jgi:hypothetical protein
MLFIPFTCEPFIKVVYFHKPENTTGKVVPCQALYRLIAGMYFAPGIVDFVCGIW